MSLENWKNEIETILKSTLRVRTFDSNVSRQLQTIIAQQKTFIWNLLETIQKQFSEDTNKVLKLKDELSKLKEYIVSLENETTSLNKDKSVLETQHATVKEVLSKRDFENKSLLEKLVDSRKTVDKVKVSLNEVETENASLMDRLNHALKTIETSKDRITFLENENKSLKEKVTTLRQEVASLKETSSS